MKIINTSVYNDETVEKLVEFACQGINMEDVSVEVKPKDPRMKDVVGYAYYSCIQIFMPFVESYPIHNLIEYPVKRKIKPGEVVWVKGKPKTSGVVHSVEQRPYGKNSPYIRCENWKEFLVSTVAHEAKHIYFYEHNTQHNGDDELESACEKHSSMRLNYYREQNEF